MPKRSTPPESDADPLWQKTPYANLVRYVPSDKYSARVRVAGKLIRRSLKTTVLSVAKLKLADFEKGERAKVCRCVVIRGEGSGTETNWFVEEDWGLRNDFVIALAS